MAIRVQTCAVTSDNRVTIVNITKNTSTMVFTIGGGKIDDIVASARVNACLFLKII